LICSALLDMKRDVEIMVILTKFALFTS